MRPAPHTRVPPPHTPQAPLGLGAQKPAGPPPSGPAGRGGAVVGARSGAGDRLIVSLHEGSAAVAARGGGVVVPNERDGDAEGTARGGPVPVPVSRFGDAVRAACPRRVVVPGGGCRASCALCDREAAHPGRRTGRRAPLDPHLTIARNTEVI